MAKTWARSEPLVTAHLKKVSVKALEKHKEAFREFIGSRKGGIYVLWNKKEKTPYYVGLASSLRARLPKHLKDNLKGKWDSFSLYLIRKGKEKYLSDLETLLIRVAAPRGNHKEGKFAKHNNITRKFERALKDEASGYFNF